MNSTQGAADDPRAASWAAVEDDRAGPLAVAVERQRRGGVRHYVADLGGVADGRHLGDRAREVDVPLAVELRRAGDLVGRPRVPGGAHERDADERALEEELARLVVPLDILRSREGDFEGTLVASVVAVRR